MDKGEPGVQKSYVHRYLTYANSLLENFHGKEPFHLYLKKYFSINKKHGSKDRKIISSLCYDWFRLGFGVSQEIESKEKLLLATFLVEQKPSKILEQLNPAWNEMIEQKILTKIDSVKSIFNPLVIFPFKDELSGEINAELFNLSFLIQPKLFIRIRPAKEKIVLDKLENVNIFFEKIGETCLAFPNNEKVSEVLRVDDEVVIQDYNSQQTINILKNELRDSDTQLTIWDCCAASGGKSILAYDLFKNIKLTVSDTRKNILENLRMRFHKAGIANYNSFIADLSVSLPSKNDEKSFDIILVDVPCSGSGTWARTPEQVSFFDKKELKKYANLQRKIVMNAMEHLKENGYLLYITCSVFKMENEDNVQFFIEKSGLKLIESEYLKGYERQADTLFVALFRKK